MIFQHHVPGPPLGSFVQLLWLYKSYQPAHMHRKERLMPDGSVALVINLRDDVTRTYDRIHLDKCRTMPGAIVCGVHTENFVIDTEEQAEVVGVQFRPGGAFPFLGVPPKRDAQLARTAGGSVGTVCQGSERTVAGRPDGNRDI